jgi:Zn-dependent protease with chaperone function
MRGLGPHGLPARHRREIVLLIFVIILTALIYLVTLAALGVDDDSTQSASDDDSGFGTIALLILAMPILIWLGRGLLYSGQRANGIKMSPTQFPQGYELVVAAATRLGLRRVPDAYVVLGNGQINAFASGHGFRRFVVVYSDLFEIGGAAREPDALAFIIGHEVGHIAAGHASYWRQLGTFAMPFLPLLGGALSRAQEYTADNCGYVFRSAGSPAAMATLGAGKYLNRDVRPNELADRAVSERGFFIWLVNALSSHPVLTWRTHALRDRHKHGKLLWRPKAQWRPPN